jgi:hypothetical protein
MILLIIMIFNNITFIGNIAAKFINICKFLFEISSISAIIFV